MINLDYFLDYHFNSITKLPASTFKGNKLYVFSPELDSVPDLDGTTEPLFEA